jgi:hypothetical protein
VRQNDTPRRQASLVRDVAIVTRWARLDAAAASSTGTRHHVNEDCTARSTAICLCSWSRTVSAGRAGVAREPPARCATACALAHVCIDHETVRRALLDADHEIRASIASRTHASGVATVALCAATDASLRAGSSRGLAIAGSIACAAPMTRPRISSRWTTPIVCWVNDPVRRLG